MQIFCAISERKWLSVGLVKIADNLFKVSNGIVVLDYHSKGGSCGRLDEDLHKLRGSLVN